MKKNSGMSLIELLVALGIGAVMLGVIGQTASSTFQFIGQAENKSAAGDTFIILRKTLNSQTQCTNNLKGTPFDVKTARNIKQIAQYNSAGNVNAPVLVAGTEDHGLTVQSLVLKPIAQVSSSLIVSNLEVTFTTNAVAGAIPQIVRDLPLFTQIVGGKIAACWSIQDQGSVNANQICSAVTDGALDTYDSANNECTLSNSKWIVGSMSEASCPAGSALPENPDPQYDCGYNLPSSFADPFPAVAVALTNGMTTIISRSSVDLNISGNSCRCAWAVDLSQAELMGVTCKALCSSP